MPYPREGRQRCLVTGANGFIGSALMQYLPERGIDVRGVTRQPVVPAGCVRVADLGPNTDWREALEGCDRVIHCAGRAHVLNESLANPLQELRRVNVEGSLALAKQALEMGVRRFVFLSSIGVNGGSAEVPFKETDLPAPHTPYAQSKFEAEQALRDLLHDQLMELVIIRLPLVYAAHAPGNFSRLLALVNHSVPLPLASLQNKRSMLALSNLLSLLEVCLYHPAAARELFLVADGDDVSTPQLIRFLAEGMGRKARLLPLPTALLSIGARIIGKQALYTQLCDSLQIDSSKARLKLGWKPPCRAHDALLDSGRGYFRGS
ncbi:NAD-dependent epimerase/dehydratase family protein [Pseudomonas xionganensis]|uniref:NAD-dependent epimerase/dehydratase family protein n=1 Tax=Pseudomonas xionganensis TaxID=2654845 RepID=A0A6I4KWK0_9PSED|nr:NAD-dependent epimerase/dehydratase family protein [Pseudomonas xionganensis]MVW76071.1 NAD-dependent epimerase/dehydratase family protein [Pseudomonas xionganensis]